MVIKGLFFNEEGKFVKGSIETEGEKITRVEEKDSGSESPDIDTSGCYIVPGFIDIHVHGCHNSDFCDATSESISDFLEYEASCGVTGICPTTMTVPEDQLFKVAEETGRFTEDIRNNPKDHEKEALFLGINMEGPFISPEKKGSQELSNIKKANRQFVEKMQEKSGNMIKLVDFAPEMPGALEFAREMQGSDVVLSIAHTNADYDTAKKATELGVHHITHLYNAMSPYEHRAPGVAGAASDDMLCMPELICDGIHNHPAIVRNTFRIFGEDRVVLISDSMRATGMPDGVYELGGHQVHVTGKRALLEDGTIAASVTNLFDCALTCIKEMDIPVETAVKAASHNPAKSIGVFDKVGSISEGKIANLLLIDKESLELKKVILKGRVLE